MFSHLFLVVEETSSVKAGSTLNFHFCIDELVERTDDEL